MSNFKFYASYINLLKQEFDYLQTIDKYVTVLKDQNDNGDPVQKDQKYIELIEQCPALDCYAVRNYMANANFREYLLQKLGQNCDTVVQLAPIMRNKILRTQKLCIADQDYYVAIDPMTNTAYICYERVMMIDFDFYKSDSSKTDSLAGNNLADINSLESSDPLIKSDSDPEQDSIDAIKSKISKYCQDKPNLRFRLYRSQGGIHAFLISQPAHYQDLNYIQIGIDLGCDFYYMIFVYLRGWSVRVNRKIKELSDKPLYSLITDIGRGKINSHQEKLVNLHINLEPVFNNIGNSKMYGG